MIADDDDDRAIGASAARESRQQRADLRVRIAQHLPVSRAEAGALRNFRLACVGRQPKGIMRAVGRNEREQRLRRRRRINIVTMHLVDRACDDVSIRRGRAALHEIADAAVPAPQPAVLVVEVRIGADVPRVVAEIAQPFRQAVESPRRKVGRDLLAPVRPRRRVERQHRRRARKRVREIRREHDAVRGKRVEMRRRRLAAAGDEAQILGAQALHHHDDDVGERARRGAIGGGDVRQRIILAGPDGARRQPDERSQMRDRVGLRRVERGPIEPEPLADERGLDGRRWHPWRERRQPCPEESAEQQHTRRARRRRRDSAGCEQRPNHPRDDGGERDDAERRHAPVRAKRLEKLVRGHDSDAAKRAKDSRRERRAGDRRDGEVGLPCNHQGRDERARRGGDCALPSRRGGRGARQQEQRDDRRQHAGMRRDCGHEHRQPAAERGVGLHDVAMEQPGRAKCDEREAGAHDGMALQGPHIVPTRV